MVRTTPRRSLAPAARPHRPPLGPERLEDRDVPASLGAALNYNALVFGDLTVPVGADAEGRVAVAGNATFQGNYVVGSPPPDSAPIGAPLPLDPTRDDLIVGGDLANDSGTGWVVNANAVYGGTFTGPDLQHADGSTRHQSPILLNPATGNAVTARGVSFARLKADLTDTSRAWAAIPDRGVALEYADGTVLNLVGNDPDLNVFNVTAGQWSGTEVSHLITAPAGSTVVVNVSGPAVAVTGGNMLLDGVDQEHVVLNFDQATAFASTRFDYQATVLAPLASATFDGGTVNGNAVFGGNVAQGGGAEFRNFRFTGDVPTVTPGQAAGIGFWASRNGQKLIESFNGGPQSTALADWLAATDPHLYGAQAGSHDLTGKTNVAVADFFTSLKDQPGTKLDAQVLAVALGVYATTSSLGGTTAARYGLTVTAGGLGADYAWVGDSGAAFGVPDGTGLTVTQLLQAADARAVNGVLYGGDPRLRAMANDVFSAINETGGVSSGPLCIRP